jgi:hypothetical protein
MREEGRGSLMRVEGRVYRNDLLLWNTGRGYRGKGIRDDKLGMKVDI